jgi:hypothetical protein
VLRQLKVQYDMFFAGALPRQPVELRAEVDRLIARYTKRPMGKYAHRFHFTALVGRYNSFCELWNRGLRSVEEGDRRVPGAAERSAPKERLVARCLIGDPGREETELRRLHSRYVEAGRRAGRTGGLPFERFARTVASQTDRLRKETGCAQIELRLVVRDDKVELKARPGR